MGSGQPMNRIEHTGRSYSTQPETVEVWPRRFAYDTELDRYECLQGELLTPDTFDAREKLAIYKAPASSSSCNACVLQASCAPHEKGRRVYHSLADDPRGGVGILRRRRRRLPGGPRPGSGCWCSRWASAWSCRGSIEATPLTPLRGRGRIRPRAMSRMRGDR
jgi:hypothetical protein